MTSNPNNNNKVINLDYLNALAKGNNNFIKEMIGIFLVDNKEEVENLEKSIQNKDFKSIKEFAHKMKSTIAFVGLNKLIENDLHEIEALAEKKTDLKKIDSIFLNIKDICDRAAKELISETITH